MRLHAGRYCHRSARHAPGGREHEASSTTVGKHSVSNLSAVRRFPAVPLAAAQRGHGAHAGARPRSGRASV